MAMGEWKQEMREKQSAHRVFMLNEADIGLSEGQPYSPSFVTDVAIPARIVTEGEPAKTVLLWT